LALAVGADDLRHVAALGDEYSAIVVDDHAPTGVARQTGSDDGPNDARWSAKSVVTASVTGTDFRSCQAEADVALLVRERFRRARLELVRLDCEGCARLALASFLGTTVAPSADGRLRDPDPLSAVSIVPECESAAAELGGRLAVPVGLALAWFGYVDAFAGLPTAEE
jgi:hypothetical protein